MMEKEERQELAGEGYSDRKIQSEPEPCLKWRYVFAILGSMGMAIIYGLKVNLSVAMVAMVNHTAVAAASANKDAGHSGTPKEHNDTESMESLLDGPFLWSSKEQGAILSAYFLGYFVTQIPGGRMAELYSGKYVFLAAVLMNTVGTLLSPVLAFLDYRALIAIRVFEGFGGGFTFPAMNVMIAAWAPPSERSTLSSIAFSGASLGTVLSMMSSGIINTLCGWEYVFYIQGSLSLVWCVLWVICVTDTPASHHFASEAEKNYITSSQPKSSSKAGEKLSVPWMKIFTSVPFMTLAVSHFCNNFGWYMLLVELPLFARSGLGVDMTITTILSSVPFFANWIFSVVYSKSLDTARAKGLISTTTARKISVLIASLVPATCLLAICLVGKNVLVVVILTILAVMFYGSMFSGVFSNQSDLAPNFAGTLMAVTNMLATIPGFLVPFLCGVLTDGTDGLAPWHTVFYMTIGILGFEAVIFTIFGKGEMQPWNSGK
eukprot:GFUD01034672.1.p1 GENE.GFUD01034672.1~~GFUD01034672.1.p1  ORF type:complete len:490 (+),score=95.67 GFUD01034672.1:74-1543(+)